MQVRTPAAGTNSPPLIRPAGPVAFCRFMSAQDGSRISVDLRTLTTRKPTLAALAYLERAERRPDPGQPEPGLDLLLAPGRLGPVRRREPGGGG